MPTNKQRREAARRHLERQLQRREERAARNRKLTLITSIAGTIVVIAAVIVAVVLIGGNNGGGDKKKSAGATSSAQPSASTTPTATPSATQTYQPGVTAQPKSTCPKNATSKARVVFDCVTVGNPTNLKKAPVVTAAGGSKTVSKIAYKDLVVGKGATANPKSSVTVQYYGVLYKNGFSFDSSWVHNAGKPVPFSLTGVIPGFTQGIGGTTGVPPMKVGGRRLIIMPASLGYPQGSGDTIPPNSSLVFVVDLTKLG